MSWLKRNNSGLHIHEIDGGLETVGLADPHGYELIVRVPPASVDGAKALLERTATYLRESGRRLQPGETIAVGAWLVRFVPSGRSLDMWEFDDAASDFVPGVEQALALWDQQSDMCRAAQMEFAPPLFNQMVVYSEGVFDGESAEGVRYPAPEHMSGWWVTTDRFDGNMKALRSEHVYHVCSARPDVARFLALPIGSRFDTRTGSAWFDPEVAADLD